MDPTEITISIVHLIACISTLWFCIFMATKQRSLLGLTGAVFLVFDSIGISFAPYYPLETLPYLSNPYFVIRQHNVGMYFRLVLCHWIFYLIVVACLLIERHFRVGSLSQHSSRMFEFQKIGLILLFVGIAAYARYFVFGPGFDRLINTQFVFENTDAAVAHRMEANPGYGEGSFLAALAANSIFPLAAAAFLLSKKRYAKGVVAVCFVLSVMYAIQTRQKSPLVGAALTFALMLAFAGSIQFEKSFQATRRKLIFVLVAAFAFLAAIYSLNFGLSGNEAIASNLVRTLLVPAATEMDYTITFPDTFAFRGPARSYYISMEQGGDDDVSIYDTATISTGATFSANASFLAVGWSGLGYLGVALVSLTLCGFLLAVDLWVPDLSIGGYLLLSALIIVPAALGLTSGSLGDFLTQGGFLNACIGAWLVKRSAVFIIPNIIPEFSFD